jgi:hypothetical protein
MAQSLYSDLSLESSLSFDKMEEQSFEVNVEQPENKFKKIFDDSNFGDTVIYLDDS